MESTSADGPPVLLPATANLAPTPAASLSAMQRREGAPEVLTPTARRTRAFPKWAALTLGVGWVLGIFDHWIDWTLFEVAYGLGLVAALVATIVIAVWAEDWLYTVLVGRNGLLRLLVGVVVPVAGIVVLLPVAGVIGSVFERVGGDTAAVCLVLGALWFSSAAVGSLVIVAIDVAISALVKGFRARVQWAVMGLLGLTTGLAVSVYGVTRFFASRLRDVDPAQLPVKLNAMMPKGESVPSEASLSMGESSARQISEILARPEVADLLAVGVFIAVAALSFPAVLSAAGKLADAVMERLHPLSLGFARMAEGNLHVRVEEKGSRDFVQISRGFNQMTAALSGAVAELDARNRDLVAVNQATQRFVPVSFLHLLGKESIRDVRRGDQVALSITVLFADIRGFTTFAEEQGAEETFRFINRYLAAMEPEIHAREGFINDFFGDGIMALFQDADGAIDAAVGMLRALETFNAELEAEGAAPIRIGVGLHTGTLMLGTIGGKDRLDCTVIGDPANLASRVEGMTKLYRANLLVSETTVAALRGTAPCLREIDRVRAKGKREPITIYEVVDGDVSAVADAKRRGLSVFHEAVRAYRRGEFEAAIASFDACLRDVPTDGAAALYVDRCTRLLEQGPPSNWDGVTSLSSK